MTFKEFAHQLAEEAKKQPTTSNMVNVVNKILNAKVDGKPITQAQINQLLGYLSDELGDYGVIFETFENKEAITLMQQINKLIAEANAGKKNG